MRQMVPGYGKGSDNAEYMELYEKTIEMQRIIDNRNIKDKALQDILSEKEYLLDTVSNKKPKGK